MEMSQQSRSQQWSALELSEISTRWPRPLRLVGIGAAALGLLVGCSEKEAPKPTSNAAAARAPAEIVTAQENQDKKPKSEPVKAEPDLIFKKPMIFCLGVSQDLHQDLITAVETAQILNSYDAELSGILGNLDGAFAPIESRAEIKKFLKRLENKNVEKLMQQTDMTHGDGLAVLIRDDQGKPSLAIVFIDHSIFTDPGRVVAAVNHQLWHLAQGFPGIKEKVQAMSGTEREQDIVERSFASMNRIIAAVERGDVKVNEVEKSKVVAALKAARDAEKERGTNR